ncbi:TolB family protein [Cerasicoccus frondis]|uniref:TolB family protein n=1 Tax=Cerasicoccus frondis TaxID=490090 RepID=UPI002852C6B5|nr:hypothetical protein [Cerasicoccus frondis]
MRLFRLIGPLLGLLFAVQFNACGQTNEFVIEKTTSKTITPVAVDSSDAATEALGKLAFSSHGAFDLVRAADARSVVKLTPMGGNQCNVKVISGDPARVIYQGTSTGTSSNDATLRACDAAVKALTGAPGFFAGTIAFISDRTGAREVWLGDVFFRTARPITSDRSNAQRPYLTPDGRTIFYRSYYRSGFSDVYKQDVASGRRVPFASYKGTNAGGAVSPNGQEVALILSSPGNSELFIQDVNQSRKPWRLTRNRTVESDPTWSPSGRRLIVASGSGSPQLYEIPSQGGVMQRIPTNLSGYCAEPTWNPLDESKVAFTASLGGGFELALYEFGKGAAKPLTSVPGNAMEPVWLNDGRHLIFTEESRGGSTKLVILDSETGKTTTVTPSNFGNASQAAFAY